MASKQTVTCDAPECGKDITETGSTPRHRLVLYAEALPHNTSMINAVHVIPSVSGTKHFCGKPCLRAWVAEDHPPERPG